MFLLMTKSSLINIFTYQLPGSVTRPIHLEYNGRKREIERILSNPDEFKCRCCGSPFRQAQGELASPEIVSNIEALVEEVLDPVRERFGKLSINQLRVGEVTSRGVASLFLWLSAMR